MPFTNFEDRHFSASEKNSINDAITSLETELANKLANLSPEERQQYGSVNEENKLIINKVKDYHDAQPTLSSPDVDWPEFDNDEDSRTYIENLMHRLESLLDGLKSSKILHDWDNYKAARSDYQFAKYKDESGAIGYATKVEELKQFFTGGQNPKPPQEQP